MSVFAGLVRTGDGDRTTATGTTENNAASDGSTFTCLACGDAFPVRRRAAHEQYWCSARPYHSDTDSDSGNSEESCSTSTMGAKFTSLSAGFANTMTSSTLPPHCSSNNSNDNGNYHDSNSECDGIRDAATVSVPQQWSSGLVEVVLAAHNQQCRADIGTHSSYGNFHSRLDSDSNANSLGNEESMLSPLPLSFAQQNIFGELSTGERLGGHVLSVFSSVTASHHTTTH